MNDRKHFMTYILLLKVQRCALSRYEVKLARYAKTLLKAMPYFKQCPGALRIDGCYKVYTWLLELEIVKCGMSDRVASFEIAWKQK